MMSFSLDFEVMKGSVLITTAPVQHGEELFMDYRLNPDLEDLPAWYQSYHPQQARMRWGRTEKEPEDGSAIAKKEIKPPAKKTPRKAIAM